MGKADIVLQIFSCLIVSPVCDRCSHPHQDLFPHLSILKKIFLKITKPVNYTHKNTTQ